MTTYETLPLSSYHYQIQTLHILPMFSLFANLQELFVIVLTGASKITKPGKIRTCYHVLMTLLMLYLVQSILHSAYWQIEIEDL